MQRPRMFVSGALMTVSVLAAAEVMSQDALSGEGAGTRQIGMPQARLNDDQTLEVVKGEITSVGRFVSEKGASYSVRATLKTAKETIAIHLGPAWYIENQELQVVPGDQVEVTGSRIIFEGKPALIASEIRKGEDVLVLRNEAGFPAWIAWKRKPVR